jgi:biuret amidohydrolase
VTRHVADTVPYPWPYDGRLCAAGLALVACGAQYALADITPAPAPAVTALRAAAAVVRAGGGHVVWVRHGRRPTSGDRSRPLPARGGVGWALVDDPEPDDDVVDAAGWDGCFSSDLETLLRARGSTYLVLGGLASELTVDSTVRTLNDRGFECLVLTDACAPTDAAMGERAHHSLTMSGGIFGALGTTDALRRALQRTAFTPTQGSPP